MTRIESNEDAIKFLREDQDESLAEFVIDKIAAGTYNLGFNGDEGMWEVRGDYQTLLFISEDEGVIVSDLLLTTIYGTSNPDNI